MSQGKGQFSDEARYKFAINSWKVISDSQAKHGNTG